ncbi:MAG: DUF2911 domain-containing protein [Candidatus Thermochlorobacter sp.]
MRFIFISLFALSSFAASAFAQKPDSNYIRSLAPRQSPMAVAKVNVGDAYIKVVYSRPFKKGRLIFGTKEEKALVPYGEVWRTGANEATEITLTKDIKIAGKPLKAGTYSLFTIPHKDKFTVLINSELGLWGHFRMNEKKEVLRFDIPTGETEGEFEAFTIFFSASEGNSTEMMMVWDKTKVVIPITVD